MCRTNEEPGRTFEMQHARGVAMDAHLVFDADAGDAIARPKTAVSIRQELWHDEERNAARPDGRIGQAGEHEVHDVLSEVVLTC